MTDADHRAEDQIAEFEDYVQSSDIVSSLSHMASSRYGADSPKAAMQKL